MIGLRTRTRRLGAWGIAIVPGLLLAAVVVSPAMAQSSEDVRAILDRMQRLERDIRTLNVQVSRGTPPPAATGGAASAAPAVPSDAAGGANPAVARLGVRMSELETDLRTATGAMEELGFRINDIRNRLDKLVADVDYRLGALERGQRPAGGAGQPGAALSPPPNRVSAAPSPPPVQKVVPGGSGSFATAPQTLGTVSENAVAGVKPPTGEGASPPKPEAAPTQPAPEPTPAPATTETTSTGVLPAGTAKEQYGYAFGLLRQANYDQAELALQEFVKLYPNEKLASNARYWLGETYYVRAAYVQAAEVFLENYRADPKGPKAADSLLKLGMSLAALDKKREACAAFGKVEKDFPKASAGVKNTVAREKQKHSCS